jgi:hypothetical protein
MFKPAVMPYKLAAPTMRSVTWLDMIFRLRWV